MIQFSQFLVASRFIESSSTSLIVPVSRIEVGRVAPRVGVRAATREYDAVPVILVVILGDVVACCLVVVGIVLVVLVLVIVVQSER